MLSNQSEELQDAQERHDGTWFGSVPGRQDGKAGGKYGVNSPPSRSSGEKQIFANAADADPVRSRDSPQASFSQEQAAQEAERQPTRGSQTNQNKAHGG